MNNVTFAQLNKEQIEQLNELENKLNVTLIAYEQHTKKNVKEETAMENSLDSSSL